MQTIGQIAAEKCLQMAERTKNLSEQNDIKMIHSNETHRNDFKNHSNGTHTNVIKDEKLSKAEYAKIVSGLEQWGVFKPRNLIYQQVNAGRTAHLKECYERTVYQMQAGAVRNAGAYFRKTLQAC